MRRSLSPDDTVKELFDRHPQLIQIFMDLGLLCVGCPTEAFHTLADVAREYHFDLDPLLQRMDKMVGDEPASEEPMA